MIDIHFYQKAFELKQRMMQGETFERGTLVSTVEGFRSPNPVVYNIETTNACNMVCKMCPRTTSMTREIESLGLGDFKKVVDQLRPWSSEEWRTWKISSKKSTKLVEV